MGHGQGRNFVSTHGTSTASMPREVHPSRSLRASSPSRVINHVVATTRDLAGFSATCPAG